MRKSNPLPLAEINQLIPQVLNHNGEAVTNSLNISKVFHKRHADLLRAIENIECSDEFSQRNFAFTEYRDKQSKLRPSYNITFDGFIFLVMGFTGKKAAELKEAYIAEFNRMKNWIAQRELVSDHQYLLNDAIKQRELLTGRADPYAYSRENDLVYIVVLGCRRSKWLKERELPQKEEIRKYLTQEQLKQIDMLIAENATMIKLGMPYAQRRERLYQSLLQQKNLLSKGGTNA